jgi:hypothetical protein
MGEKKEPSRGERGDKQPKNPIRLDNNLVLLLEMPSECVLAEARPARAEDCVVEAGRREQQQHHEAGPKIASFFHFEASRKMYASERKTEEKNGRVRNIDSNGHRLVPFLYKMSPFSYVHIQFVIKSG